MDQIRASTDPEYSPLSIDGVNILVPAYIINLRDIYRYIQMVNGIVLGEFKGRDFREDAPRTERQKLLLLQRSPLAVQLGNNSNTVLFRHVEFEKISYCAVDSLDGIVVYDKDYVMGINAAARYVALKTGVDIKKILPELKSLKRAKINPGQGRKGPLVFLASSLDQVVENFWHDKAKDSGRAHQHV